jgi:ADP-heptose:LPS heptosyltransferase
VRPHVLIARLDSAGDVLLAGPAIRAVAAGARRVSLLVGPRGRDAAGLLPGVDEVHVWCAPWIDPDPEPVDPARTVALVRWLEECAPDQAIVLTSFHQSALPLALLLRLAGVPMIAAISEDYPGSLLDVRHRVSDDIHEVERSLSLVDTLGYRLPAGDDGGLRVNRPGSGPAPVPWHGYVAVHPGASVPARAWAPERSAALVNALVAAGDRVVVTGGAEERALGARVAGPSRPAVRNLAGQLSLADLAHVLARADVLVVGNTGPAHLAAAVGTPVVSLFAPTVPAVRWRPWGVPHALLGQQTIACAGCRARSCPFVGHPCLASITIAEAVTAVARLRVAGRQSRATPPAGLTTGAGDGRGGWNAVSAGCGP